MANNQHVNKVVYGGDTLIDLTADTAVPADVAVGKYFHLKSGERVAGTSTKDMDTSGLTADASEILAGETAGVNGNVVTGTMPNRGGLDVIVEGTTGTTIPAGYFDGSSKAKLDATSLQNLVPNNIRENVTICGVVGTMSGGEGVNPQAKTVTPSTTQQVVTPDSPTYNYLSQVTVNPIPYTETDNAAGGKTVTIAA